MLQDFFAGRPDVSSTHPLPAVPAARDAGFQPFFAARAAALAPVAGARRLEGIPESEALDAPQIELVQDNGVVQRIIVTCTCCKRIEIECEY